MAICDKCRASFNKRKVEEETNEYYGKGKYKWVCDNWGTFCGDCIYEYLNDDDDYEDGGDEGCAACGNPAYPECKSSCPLFDDDY